LRSFVLLYWISLLLKSQYDSSLFFYKTALGIVILLVSINDIMITGSDL
jgi:hypothetical protein